MNRQKIYRLLSIQILVLFAFSLNIVNADFQHTHNTHYLSIFSAVNQNRNMAGLQSVNMTERAMAAAQAKADEMVRLSEFRHSLSSGFALFDLVHSHGYSFFTAGENLALFYSNGAEAVEGWMQSPSHRSNILNDRFEEVGIGVAEGSWFGYDGTVYVLIMVQDIVNKSQ